MRKLSLALLLAVACGHVPRKTAGMQARECDRGTCQEGLTCLQYLDASDADRILTTCEIPCAASAEQCPRGQACVDLVDGPGIVCRPASE